MRTCLKNLLFVVCVFALLLSGCGQAANQSAEDAASNNNSAASSQDAKETDYPTKPIDLMVAFAPGGSTDLVARALADNIAVKWGQPINVINKEGGSGTTGTVEAIQAKPDGYTVLMHVPTSGVLNPAIQSNLPYQWDQFTFIARTNISPLVVIVKADSKWKTLAELVDDIKKDPSKYSYGSAGPGGPSTFATAQIMEQAGVDPAALTKVVFGGGAPTVTAVAGGQVDFAVQNLVEVVDLIRGGKLRGLAISNGERVKSLPDVPTAKEAGFDQFTFQGWNGLVAPLNFPEEAAKRWNEAIKEALEDKELADRLESMGLLPAYLGPEEFKEALKKDYEFARSIAERLNLRE